MRSFYQFLVVSMLFWVTSCTVTENIYVNTDGSGKFNVDLDGSGLITMMPKDSLMGQKNLDSTFTFKQIMAENRDSIAKLSLEEQELLKKLENFNVRMQMNKEQKQFLFSLHTDFKNVSDLQDAMVAVNAISALQNKGFKSAEFGSGLLQEGIANNNSTLVYTLKGNIFSRIATSNKNATKNADNEATEMNKMIFASSNYILKYHFEKPVKKVSNASALFSEDRKTITIQYPFSEYMDHPEKMNIVVEF